MKHTKLLFAVLCISLFALYSCSKDKTEPEQESYLTVVETEFAAEVNGGALYATVTSNRDVTVEPKDTWCDAKLTPNLEQNNLKLTVAANDGPERTATVLLTAPDCESVTITVTQPKREEGPYLTVSETKFTIDAAGGELYATVTSNRDVTLQPKDTWCTAELLSDVERDNLKLTVEANDGAGRTTTILVSAPDCEDIEITVVQELHESADCDLLTFSINGAANGLKSNIVFDFDKVERSLSGMYLKWIENEEPAMLIPTFTINGAQVLVNNTPVVSGQTKVSFAENVVFVVVAENGDTKTYTITLNCPQINTELPVLRMQPDGPITSKDDYVKTKLDLYSPTTTSGWWSSNDEMVEVRGRGNSTWGLPKKPYRIKFPSKFSPIGLNHAKEKSWVILANDMDKSLIRDHLGFAMSRDMFNAADGYHDPAAIMFSPCTQSVNVYMNNDYHGVYLMSDQMEQATGRIAVDKLTAADGSNPDKITGGYIIESDLHEGNFISSKGIKFSYKYPKDDDCDPAQYQYISDFIRQAETALYGSNFEDPVNGWRKYFDEKTLADFIILKEYVGDLDGYTSTYAYKRRGVDKLFFGPIWDVDKGWDNDKRNGDRNPLQSLMIYAGFYMPPYINPDWFHRFWQDETFKAFVGARWASKKAQLTATVMRILDEQPVAMAKAIEANFTVWPFYYQASEEAKMPAATYAKEIERIRTLTNSRAALLDRLLK